MNAISNLLNQHVIIEGRRIATGIHGEGLPVVLLHGTPAHSYIWRNVVPLLVEAGFKVHLFDLLGFGASEFPRDQDTSIAKQRLLLEQLLDHWGLSHAHLIAHDIGGATALRLAIEAPQRVQSLTIADICSYDSWPSITWRDIRDHHADHAAADAEQHRALMTRQLGMAVFNKSVMQGEVLEQYLAPITGLIGQVSFYKNQVAHYNARYTEDHAERLPELRVPTQILWGAEDEWQSVSYAHRLHSDIPGSSLYLLENAGHFLMEDAPDEFAAKAIAFIHSQA
ncbi:alpha/beta fold hydrolase [Pseudomonas syringae]|jgi:pimeloyl-ACP methyl ester carboxylesterase|uniref:Alpha/beta hydrolase n=1 Tax=Pseudomonas syringae TaxID=317 RepID=A0A085V248_PSESX|nr:alpha/beta hydrolase [Pseudomonas syringae]KFE49511.1 alpha/beta hydrolase [Pseudomonas syringae]